jgi:hypothetical protein
VRSLRRRRNRHTEDDSYSGIALVLWPMVVSPLAASEPRVVRFPRRRCSRSRVCLGALFLLGPGLPHVLQHNSLVHVHSAVCTIHHQASVCHHQRMTAGAKLPLLSALSSAMINVDDSVCAVYVTKAGSRRSTTTYDSYTTETCE